MNAIAALLRPNMTSMGYALFLAVNAAGVWGGVFPFLPADFQTPTIILGFFFGQSLVYTMSYFASTLGVYFFPAPTRRFLVLVAAAPYFTGWCCLIGAIYLDCVSLPLVTVGGALLGLGSAGFYMLWQRLFASQEADTGNRSLILGTLIASLLYYALYLIPRAITAFLIPLVFLPLFGLCIVLKSREIDLDQPMFEDIPRKHPAVYRKALRDYTPSAFCIGALGFCCGIVRALAIETPAIGALVNIVSMGGSLVAALVLLVAWRNKNIHLNVITIYRFFFPVLITAFLVMPIAGTAFSSGYAAILYAAYSAAIMLMMIQCAQASRDGGINPVFIYGFFGGIVYLLHDIGFAVGTFSENLSIFGMNPLAATAVLAIYLLGMMYFISHGGFRNILNPGSASAGSIEFVSLNASHLTGRAFSETGASAQTDSGTDQSGLVGRESVSLPSCAIATDPGGFSGDSEVQADDAFSPLPNKQHESARERTSRLPINPRASHPNNPLSEPQYRDRISKQCALVQQCYRLSNRETEVMDLLVRGNTVAHIAEDLVVSENTIRTHSKRIYAKLNVHKKQELIDLVTLFNPADLPHR